MGIKLLVVEDHQAVRLGIRGLLEKTDIKITAEVENGEEAVKIARSQDFDVVLMDVRLPKIDGLEALGRIKLEKPLLPILMYSTYDNPLYIARSVALGACGFLLKSASRAEFIQALQLAATGAEVWRNEQLRYASSALATPRYGANLEISLTRREGEVLQLVTIGKTNKEIAVDLNISTETVKEHIRTILHKIGVSDRTQAAIWAVRKKLV